MKNLGKKECFDLMPKRDQSKQQLNLKWELLFVFCMLQGHKEMKAVKELFFLI